MSLPPALRHEHPIAMAHRGSMVLWPENTMTAFQGAVDLGYRYLETDIRRSRDGVLMVFHDARLDRTTDGTGVLNLRSRAELQELDAAYRFERNGGFPHRGAGIRIPTLEELVTTYPEAVFSIDMKEGGLEAPLADFIRDHDLWDRVIIGSFSGRRLRRFRSLVERPVAMAAGPGEMARFLFNTRRGRPSRLVSDSMQVPTTYRGVTVIDRKTVTAAHAAFKQIIVWTVNDAEQMRTLLDLGVDGIITDRPDLLKAVMEERGAGGPWHGGTRRE